MNPRLQNRLKNLINKTYELEDRISGCAHVWRCGGESKIRPGTVNSLICDKCGARKPTWEIDTP